MLLGDVVDQFLDQHGLAHTGTTEQAHFAALAIGSQQIDHLDAGLEHLGLGFEVGELGCRAVNRRGEAAIHRPFLVDGLTQDIEDAAQGAFAHGHRDWRTRVHGHHAAHQAVGAAHRHGADAVVAEQLLHFGGEGDGLAGGILGFDPQGVVNAGQLAGGKLHVQHRADDLLDDALGAGRGGSSSCHGCEERVAGRPSGNHPA